MMPYLRMFLGEKQVDEVFISEVLLNSVLGNSVIEEEKQEMLRKHGKEANTAGIAFFMDSMPSALNQFVPLTPRKPGEQ